MAVGPALTSLSLLTHVPLFDGAAAVYVGADWLLYVDAAGAYAQSEMVAPCLLLAQPGSAMRVQGEGGQCLNAAAILHAPGGSSCGLGSDASSGQGAAFLYFDPLGSAGRALVQLCGVGLMSEWRCPSDCAWTEDWFDALCAGQARRAAVSQWVGSVCAALTEAAAPAQHVDRRIGAVASLLHEDLAGRLSVGQLAAHVFWSPEHLRKTFREVVGMSLSRYQMWCRLHRLVDAACQHAGERAGLASAEGTLLDAGFYDAPHGSRAVRRYFGLTAGMALQPHIRRADCRGH